MKYWERKKDQKRIMTSVSRQILVTLKIRSEFTAVTSHVVTTLTHAPFRVNPCQTYRTKAAVHVCLSGPLGVLF